ncbi:MAG TPA: hypothetical protein PK402_10750 [Tepidisphaeraceae bacterium]|nr:hypothetical protein [Tepidisphaeraceae bacterium]
MRLTRPFLRRFALCCGLSMMAATTDLGATSFTNMKVTSENNQSVVELPMSMITSGKQPRLRRLHLVRPDLIPYPLQSEFVC